MGVADGVYMWKELGIDSGTMARTLMETCQHMVAAGCEDVYKSERRCDCTARVERSGARRR
jgi:protein phosphatase PTC7